VYDGSVANKAKPVSLHPLTFHEALKALVKAKPKAKKRPQGHAVAQSKKK
jgi:hypothetical protein